VTLGRCVRAHPSLLDIWKGRKLCYLETTTRKDQRNMYNTLQL